MRIIAGTLRGRTFLPPASDATRPITDRVKQSVFDILAPDIFDAVVYDCFAGTGSMGLECLSRGAKAVTFFEADSSAVTILKKNIRALNVGDRSTVIAGDLFNWFSRPQSFRLALPPAGSVVGESHSRPEGGPAKRTANLIFLDPPYRMLRENSEQLQTLAAQFVEHLTPDGQVIFRHDRVDELSLPPLRISDRREYGGMIVELLVN